MWMMTKHGFYSVVEHRDDVNTLLIRARAREDLDALMEVAASVRRRGEGEAIGFEADRIFLDERADYHWRIIVPRSAWHEVSAGLMNDIDYPNFKSAVKDKDRANLYMRVWSTLLAIQRPAWRQQLYGQDSLLRTTDWPTDMLSSDLHCETEDEAVSELDLMEINAQATLNGYAITKQDDDSFAVKGDLWPAAEPMNRAQAAEQVMENLVEM